MNFTGYRRDIDGLRTLAVVPVVLGHAGLGLFAGGFVGVDVFFVISGFLITGILVRELEQGRFSLIDFYERRARRILPALFVVLLACIVVFWFVLSPVHFQDLGKSGVATLLFASNVFFWRRGSDYFSADVETQPLLHTWSLAVEEQFYIVFPVLLWLIAAWRRTSRTLLIAGLSLASFALAVWMVPRHPVAAFYLTPTRVWELGLGALLALGAFPALRHRLLAELVAAAGLVAIAWAVFTLDKTDPFPGLNALAPCLGAVAIIWAGQSQITLTGRLLSTRGMVGIGLMSYSLYLVHWPVLVAARILTSARGNLDPATIVICLMLSLALAWASWRFVERPFRTHKGGTRFGRRAIFALSGAGGAALLGLFALLIMTQGVPQRLPSGLAAEYIRVTTAPSRIKTCGIAEIGVPGCRLGSDADRAEGRLILWGDSHARVAADGLDDWMAEHRLIGVSFYKPGCLPLLGVQRTRASGPDPCQAHNRQVIDWITSQGPVDTIVLHARWILAGADTASDDRQSQFRKLYRVSDSMPQAATSEQLLREGLMQTMVRLRPLARRIVIIGQMPDIGFNVPKRTAEAAILRQSVPVGPDIATYDQTTQTTHAILRDVAQFHNGFFVSPRLLLCADHCAIRQNGAFLYQDDNHLSVLGSRLILPQLLDMVNELSLYPQR
ncbi:acyltransferase [Loktanella sp. TSTF-M6]|uniref:Acyltransferase n=1 Tax=Loktanella gaetbuli TaxID=2881335 RepID=A0ABS8BY72_9RHOB|nr:acyltransferase family protein [Loktanella gaetbuli]MCB5200693.1 acyltransferase [Loktanella gaetbuli]